MRRWPMSEDDEMVDIPRMSMSQSAHDEWKTSPELARLKQAYERVKSFPDAKHPWPPEMLELRQAVELLLRRWGP
jgi:hypothetical protein